MFLPTNSQRFVIPSFPPSLSLLSHYHYFKTSSGCRSSSISGGCSPAKMNHDGGSARMTMQFFHTTPASPSWSASSSLTDFADPNPYSSIFFPTSTSDHSTSPTGTTSAAASSAGDLSLLMLEHQDLLSRFKIRLSQLQKTFREAETLRQENTNLRVANGDLSHRLNRLVEANLGNKYGSSSLSPEIPTPPVFSKFGCRWESGESLISVIESDRGERDVDRVSFPKSISVRSNGFLKVAGQIAPKGTSIGPSRGVNRHRPGVPADAPQKVYVRGGNKKEGAIQVEVQNQGMFKTELCNKWQETGSCPYGEHCQFAHGFEELRPVLRHPRYKTEVCRMVLAGETCPYGHRCHFRHALTEQEQLMVPLNLD